MSNPDQLPFHSELYLNPEPRCPCLLLLDTSASMQGAPIEQLNQGLQTFKQQLMLDSIAAQRVEVGIITFGPVKVISHFQTADEFIPPSLASSGNTPIGQAIETGIEMIEARKHTYKQAGINYYRPWIFLITDGAPTDNWQRAAQAIRTGDSSEKKKFVFFGIGVDDADMDTLSLICNSSRPPLKLRNLSFRELFCWLSDSLSRVSNSHPGDQVALPAPTGWTNINV